MVRHVESLLNLLAVVVDESESLRPVALSIGFHLNSCDPQFGVDFDTLLDMVGISAIVLVEWGLLSIVEDQSDARQIASASLILTVPELLQLEVVRISACKLFKNFLCWPLEAYFAILWSALPCNLAFDLLVEGGAEHKILLGSSELQKLLLHLLLEFHEVILHSFELLLRINSNLLAGFNVLFEQALELWDIPVWNVLQVGDKG